MIKIPSADSFMAISVSATRTMRKGALGGNTAQDCAVLASENVCWADPIIVHVSVARARTGLAVAEPLLAMSIATARTARELAAIVFVPNQHSPVDALESIFRTPSVIVPMSMVMCKRRLGTECQYK